MGIFKLSLAAIGLILTAVGLSAQYVGLSEFQVIQKLGEPMGSIDMLDARILMFERGNLVLQNDRVSASYLLTEEEYRLQMLAREDARKRWRAIEEERLKIIKERAIGLKEDKLKDPSFLALPLEQQINFWRSFQAVNPEVSIEPFFSDLLLQYRELLDDKRVEQLSADYKERIAAAEERVAQARKEAAQVQSTPPLFRYQYPPVMFYGSPVYVPREPILRVHYSNDKVGIDYQSGSTPNDSRAVIKFLP